MRFAIPLALLGALIGLLAYGLTLDPREVPSPLIGKRAPAFDLPVLGQETRLSPAALEGRAVLVNYFASWCAGCRVEHPLLLKLAKESGVAIIGMDYKDEPADGQQWLAQLGNPYQSVVLDRQGSAGLDWGVYGVPETFVVGPDGIILYKQIGPMTEAAWHDKVQPLLLKFGGAR